MRPARRPDRNAALGRAGPAIVSRARGPPPRGTPADPPIAQLRTLAAMLPDFTHRSSGFAQGNRPLGRGGGPRRGSRCRPAPGVLRRDRKPSDGSRKQPGTMQADSRNRAVRKLRPGCAGSPAGNVRAPSRRYVGRGGRALNVNPPVSDAPFQLPYTAVGGSRKSRADPVRGAMGVRLGRGKGGHGPPQRAPCHPLREPRTRGRDGNAGPERSAHRFPAPNAPTTSPLWNPAVNSPATALGCGVTLLTAVSSP